MNSNTSNINKTNATTAYNDNTNIDKTTTATTTMTNVTIELKKCLSTI